MYEFLLLVCRFLSFFQMLLLYDVLACLNVVLVFVYVFIVFVYVFLSCVCVCDCLVVLNVLLLCCVFRMLCMIFACVCMRVCSTACLYDFLVRVYAVLVGA